MACTVLSALASLCIQAAKTGNQIYSGLLGKWICLGGGENSSSGRKLDMKILMTFLWKGEQINAIIKLKQQEQLLILLYTVMKTSNNWKLLFGDHGEKEPVSQHDAFFLYQLIKRKKETVCKYSTKDPSYLSPFIMIILRLVLQFHPGSGDYRNKKRRSYRNWEYKYYGVGVMRAALRSQFFLVSCTCRNCS